MAKQEAQKLTRTQPYSKEAEQAILGIVLLDNSINDKVFPVVEEDDFFIAQHRIIFRAMKKLFVENKPIDTIGVSDELDYGEKIEEAGGYEYISSLVDLVPSSANIEYWIEILKRESLRRKVIEIGNEITSKAYELESGEESLDIAQKLIYDLSQRETKTDLQQIGKAATAANLRVQKSQVGQVEESVVFTNFPQLDSFTRGFKKGEVIILAARPAVGKSAFAFNIAVNAAVQNKKHVAVFNLEMEGIDIATRMLAYMSGVSFDKMNSVGGMQSADQQAFYSAYSQLIASTLYVDDDSMNTPTTILSKCRRLKKEHGLDLVIVDYLQLMNSDNAKKNDSRVNDVGDMSRKMKIYARELGVPIIVLSQMSRSVELGDNHEPQLAHLRESGSIEQDADIVAFLSNPSKFDKSLPENEIILYIKKNRHGKTGDIKYLWDGSLTKFQEIEGTAVSAGSQSTQANVVISQAPQNANSTSSLKPIEDSVDPFKNDSYGTSLTEVEDATNPFEDEDGNLNF